MLARYDNKVETITPDVVPVPMGYRLLIAIPAMKEKVGSIIIPDNPKGMEQTASIVGQVIQLGPDAYLDASKFPKGAWCKEGDWIIFKSYSGTRFKVGEQEFRLINDDTVEAVVADPRMIKRA